MSLTTEVLSPVTTAAGLYPALSMLISQIAMPNMVARQFLQPFTLQASNSITFPKQSGSASAVINEVAEGSEILLDMTDYSFVNVVPYKVGHGFIVSRETIEDSLLPIQQDQIVRASMRAANKIDQDCITTILAGIATQNQVQAAGQSMGMDGTVFTFSGSGAQQGYGVGQYDLVDAKRRLETGSYMPDTLLVDPTTKMYIEKNPHFISYLYVGRNVIDAGLKQVPGAFGTLLGLDAYCSVNCTTGSAFVLSRGRTANILGQYSPLGFFVEKRPLTTAVKPIEERDSVGVFITCRYSPVVIRGEASAMVNDIGF